MKRFHFRLARVLRWRAQSEQQRRQLHALAVAELARAERALAEHDREHDALIRAAAQRRRAPVPVELWVADDRVLDAFRASRARLDEAVRVAARVAEQTRAELVVARRELETVETLRRTRRERWHRESEAEAQKHADEMHRARMVRGEVEAGNEADELAAGHAGGDRR